MKIVVCADKNVEAGLHVTLFSLMDHCQCEVQIYLIQDGLHKNEIDRLHTTLNCFQGRYKLTIIEQGSSDFNKFSDLAGNHYPYAKLLISNLVQEDKVLYIDCDTIIFKDLEPLYNSDLEGHVISAMVECDYTGSSDFELFDSLGMETDASYFNSGVMLMDLNRWRNERISEQCFDFANKHPNDLKTADQTTMNYVFYKNNFKVLDNSFNRLIYAWDTYKAGMERDNVIHLLGIPKPWIIEAYPIPTRNRLFMSVLRKTAMRSVEPFSQCYS